ncbi:MAG: sensor domain-containing diguanylate cyclase [Candidatus Omnitrophica bacterium]|nr:sensor domain-containing diguanylate cyclase [Candidatus Omnitrophota bacterium]
MKILKTKKIQSSNKPAFKKPALTKRELEKLFTKAKNELIMLSEITNCIMGSLKLDQVLYTILTALTSHAGLGFDRAMFFIVNKKRETLEGKMAIGPHSAEEADKIWQHVYNQELELNNLLKAYEKFKTDPGSKLNSIVQGIRIPLRVDTGILALTILEGMPFEITTREAKSMANDRIKKWIKMDLFVTIPLKTKTSTFGVILVDNIFSKKTITKDNLRILNMFANHAALAIENSRLYEKTVHLSRTDWLTGLWNTRYFSAILEKKLKKAKETKNPTALLMIDIDNFKRFNDKFGHRQGDDAIKKVADTLNRYSRGTDFVCRYGGEEFCIIMSKTNKAAAKRIAERLRKETEKSFKKDKTIPKEYKLTISLGLAFFPNDTIEKNDFINKADQALYRAKQTGKNIVCVYSTDFDIQ